MSYFPAQQRLPFALCNNCEIVLLVRLLTVDNRNDLKVWNVVELCWYCLLSSRVVSSRICVVLRSVTFLYHSEPEIEPPITNIAWYKGRGTKMYAISGSDIVVVFGIVIWKTAWKAWFTLKGSGWPLTVVPCGLSWMNNGYLLYRNLHSMYMVGLVL